jgi:hypothetical protein
VTISVSSFRRIVNGSTADRPSLHGARHPRVSGWLKLGCGTTARSGAVSGAASHHSGGRPRKCIIIVSSSGSRGL